MITAKTDKKRTMMLPVQQSACMDHETSPLLPKSKDPESLLRHKLRHVTIEPSVIIWSLAMAVPAVVEEQLIILKTCLRYDCLLL